MTACQEYKLCVAQGAFQLVADPPYLLWGLHLNLGDFSGLLTLTAASGPTPGCADALREIILSTTGTPQRQGWWKPWHLGAWPLFDMAHTCALEGLGQGGPKMPLQALTWSVT